MEDESSNLEARSIKSFSNAATLLLIFLLLVMILNLVLYLPAKVTDLSSYTSLISQALALIILILVKKPKDKKLKQFFTAKVPPLLYILIGISAILLLIIIPPLVSMFPIIYDGKPVLNKINTTYLLIYGSLVVPVLEEVFFRGLILGDFLKLYDHKRAILYSSILFAIVHINPPLIIAAFFGGLLLGWLYYKTRSLIPCIVLHALINSSNGVIYNYTAPNGTVFSNHIYLYLFFYLICICGLGASLLGMKKILADLK